MKKLLFLFAAITIAACTSTSTNEKVKEVVINEARNSLSNPESFDTLSIVIDTTFICYNNELATSIQGIGAIVNKVKLRQDLLKIQEEHINELKSMGVDLSEAKRDLDEAQNEVNEAENLFLAKQTAIETAVKKNSNFTGYKVTISFRGDGTTHNVIYYLSKEPLKVIENLDKDSKEYKEADAVLQWFGFNL